MSGISIIIVNYNVKYFLRQCLQSIYRSDFDGDIKVYVVDNASVDGSQEMVLKEFPEVHLISNKDNVGFSRANNQAIAQATTSYTLILNPDTIIQEDTLRKCVTFMESHPAAGALGVKMVDGSGTYLPESKRGFPTPLSAFYKMTGLSKLFPKSPSINHYYMGNHPEDEVNEVDVLTGAFTFARTEILQQVGGFDEDYFMYGEDIELSYQIKAQGHKIYYYPKTQIIHFKGESTRKLSSGYLKNFYGAMGIYAQKRNTASSKIWSWLLKVAILISAVAGLLKKVSLSQFRPVVDVVLLVFMARGIQQLWATWYFGDSQYYDNAIFYPTYSILALIIVFCYYLFGQYDQRHNLKHLMYAFAVSTLASLSIYSLLPLNLRSSRIILLIVTCLAPFLYYFTRRVYNGLLSKASTFNIADAKRVAIIGSENSEQKIKGIVSKFSGVDSYVGRISLNDVKGNDENLGLGTLDDLNEIVRSRGINELVFCSRDLPTKDIFRSMSAVGNSVTFKVANNDNTTILGSSSKERVGEWYAMDISFRIDEPFHRRTKRLLDVMMSLLVMIGFLFVLLFSRHASKLFTNSFSVLMGKKTWIGYSLPDSQINALPVLNACIFHLDEISGSGNGPEDRHASNLYYAKNFTTWSEAAELAKIYFGRRNRN